MKLGDCAPVVCSPRASRGGLARGAGCCRAPSCTSRAARVEHWLEVVVQKEGVRIGSCLDLRRRELGQHVRGAARR